MEVIGVGVQLHHGFVAQVACLVYVAFVKVEGKIVVERTCRQVVVIVDEYVLLCHVGAYVGKSDPEHRVAYGIASEISGTVEDRTYGFNVGLHAALAGVKFPTFDDVVAQYFVGGYVGRVNLETRVLFGRSFGVMVHDMETVKDIAHFYTVLVSEHLAPVKVFVGRYGIRGQKVHCHPEQVVLAVYSLFGVV